jgi:uncharacterized membrane protein
MFYLLHPATIHFPIALLLVNYGLTIWAIRHPDPFVERTAYGALLLGWCGTAAAIATGLLAAALVWPPDDQLLAWLNAHAILGFALLFVYGRALLWRRRDPELLAGPRRGRYLALLSAGALLVVLDGWIGGHMVYRLGTGVR